MTYNSNAPLKDGNPIAALHQRNLEGGSAMPIKYKSAPCSQEELHSMLDYDSDTGDFVWKGRKYAPHPKKAGRTNHDGYIHIKIYGKTYLAHRVAWLHFHGEWPEECIDHLNLDRSDNRISNLRKATYAENSQNRNKQTNNTSGYVGVYWLARFNKFQAQIRVNGRLKSLGYYLTAEDAHAAYLVGKAKYHTFNPVPAGG